MDFTPDLAVWQGQITRKAMDLKEVYALMKQDKEVVEAFLERKGIGRDAYAFLSIDILPQNKTVNHYNNEGDLVDREQVFNGYRLNRGFKVVATERRPKIIFSHLATGRNGVTNRKPGNLFFKLIQAFVS